MNGSERLHRFSERALYRNSHFDVTALYDRTAAATRLCTLVINVVSSFVWLLGQAPQIPSFNIEQAFFCVIFTTLA